MKGNAYMVCFVQKKHRNRSCEALNGCASKMSNVATQRRLATTRLMVQINHVFMDRNSNILSLSSAQYFENCLSNFHLHARIQFQIPMMDSVILYRIILATFSGQFLQRILQFMLVCCVIPTQKFNSNMLRYLMIKLLSCR